GFSLDGVDDYIRVPDNPNLYPDAGSFTVEAWVKTPQTGHYEMIMQHYECGGSSCAYSVYQLYITPDGKLVGFLRDESTNSEDLQSTTIVADNVFHHVAMVRDTTNGQFLLFVDGVQAASAPLTVVGTIKNADGEADPVTIGEGFSGIIDEVEYFNRALSSSEIQAIYDAGSAGKCKPQFTCTPPPPSMGSWWPGD